MELYKLLETFNGFLWCPVMLVLLVGTGIYLNIALRFFSFRNWVRAYKCLWQGRSHQSEHGEISPWNALMTALAADIGTGNVVGVSLAIAVGGPGALFWMWVTALVGMMTKFSEVLLSVHFREKTPAGNWVGGAMYFIKNGLGPKWVWLGTCFAVFGICACIGTGGMVQAKAITDNISGTFGLPAWLCGLILVGLCVAVLLGGVRRIGAVAGKIVPFMAIMYVFMCLLIIGMNIEKVPSVFWWVISDAFQPTAATGGFVGATVMMAIRQGMARGIFSNEAGLGTAPMAHAASTAETPLVQASIGMLDVFIDTIIVCSMTGFVILVTGTWSAGSSAASMMTSMAFEQALPGVGQFAVTICLTFFAFTTILGWCVYGERCAIYLFGDRAQMVFRLVYCLAVGVGSVLALDAVWLLADTCNALMALPNLTGVLLLSPVLFKIVRDEVARDDRFVV